MKENELRLNNLVMYNYKTDLLSKVTWIQEGSINVIFDRQTDLVNGVVCSPNDLIPIPLTEEWLLKAGFKLCENFIKGVYVNYWFKYPIKIKNSGKSKSIYFNGAEFTKNIIYIHQLQNLYFALVGEELVFSSTGP